MPLFKLIHLTARGRRLRFVAEPLDDGRERADAEEVTL